MDSRELVRRAIEFRRPERIPFCQRAMPFAPDDVWDVWEMDRARAGWFFDNAAPDDWGCQWARTEKKNMGQVVGHPLADWSALDRYIPPNPKQAFYFERLGSLLDQAGPRYVLVTSHFNLIERLHMLHGFRQTMEDFFLDPQPIERVLDMVLEFKLGLFEELHRRFGDRIDGLFLTDDWGTQQGLFVSPKVFDRFFAPRYQKLFGAIHAYGWHVMLHSCGRVNDLVPRLVELGVDVLNMQQPRAYGLVEFGERFRGQVCFLTTVDIQSTLPRGRTEEIREEARLLVRHWSTPEGGLIFFNYGDGEALGISAETTRTMFEEFVRLAGYWRPAEGLSS